MIKNLWVWTLKPTDIGNLIHLCEKEGIKNIFLSNKDTAMINIFKNAGLKVDFLLGLAYPFTANDVLKECKNALSYGFDGIHLDLEGSNGALDYQLSEAISNLKLVLGEIPDIDIQCGQSSDKYFQAVNQCNSAHLMCYRKSAIGMYIFAKNVLSKIKIPFYVGFETSKTTEDISYYDLGKKVLDKQIFWADLIFRLLYKNYKGVSIHYYETYSQLK